MGVSIRVFLNTNSGSGSAATLESGIEELFARHDCSCTISPVNNKLQPRSLALSDPPGMAYVAAGGDGTVNLVASTVLGTDRPIGVLPVGTLNHFAKDACLPTELELAVAVIATAHTRRVDAAQVNGQTFVNNSSLGVYPETLIDRERMQRSGRGKWLALVVASARAFFRFRSLTVELDVNGRPQRCTTPFLFVGNNEYCLDGAQLGKREHLDRAVLSLYLAPGATRSTMLWLLIAALFGRLKGIPDFQHFQATHFRVSTAKRIMRVSLDGELRRIPTPLEYRVCPGGLALLSPLEGVGTTE